MQNELRLWPLLLCSFLILAGCKQDDDLTGGPNQVPVKNNCAVSISFEAETTTIMKPLHPAEANRLTTLDRALLLPQRDRKREAFCFQADGNFSIVTDILTPEHPIEYPPNTVGVWPKPKYARSVNENGIASYYNEEGEKIDEQLLGSAAISSFLLVEAFQDTKDYPLEDNEDALVSQFLDSLGNRGITLTDWQDGIVALEHVQADGSSSFALIDKQARMKVGQVDFDTEGYPIGAYFLKVSGRAPHVTLERMTQLTHFQAVESKVELWLNQTTTYHDFELNF